MSGEILRRLRALEEKLRPPQELEAIRSDVLLSPDEAYAVWRVLFADGGRELVSDVYLAEHPDEPALAELIALIESRIESEELVDEAERIARGDGGRNRNS